MAIRDIAFTSEKNVTSVQYDNETQELTVTFHHGGTYQYRNVPESVAVGFESAPSAGQYLNGFIKNLYEYEKV